MAAVMVTVLAAAGPIQLSCSVAEKPEVCRGSFCQDAGDLELVLTLCPRFCGFCTQPHNSLTTQPPPVETCVDHVLGGIQCSAVPEICDNVYGRLICNKHCGGCVSTPGAITPPPQGPTSDPTACVDYVTGTYTCQRLPHVCQDRSAKLLCPKHCRLCGTSPAGTAPATAPTTTDCTDHLINGYSCQEIPGVCNSPYGRLVCRRYCGECSGPTPAAPADVTPAPESCADIVGEGLTCQQLAGVCGDSTRIGSMILCRRFCKDCHDPLDECQDNLIYDLDCNAVPHICSTDYRIACKRFCELCNATGPEPPRTSPPPGGCFDRLGGGLTCQQLPIDCTQPIAQVLCPRHCRLCGPDTTSTAVVSTTSTTAPGLCVDLVQDCRALEPTFSTGICNDVFGRKYCHKYCGLCNDTCLPSENPSCKDEAEFDVCNLHLFCDDPYAQVVCRKTCEFCDPGCEDKILQSSGTNCTRLYGEGTTFPDLAQLCDDPLGAAACVKTCGCKGYCSQP